MKIAGTHIGIQAMRIAFIAAYKGDFSMHFDTGYAVIDPNAGFLKGFTPTQVGLFIEPGFLLR